jgi:hypothetical protein
MSGRDDPMKQDEPVGWDRAAAQAPGATIVPPQATVVHADRRRRALDRLEGLTTGLAVAGVAGTAGFAILAAATWSGVPGVRNVNDLPAVVGNGGGASGGLSSGGSGSGGGSGVQPVEPNGGLVDPNGGTSGGSSGTQITPRIRPAQPRSGHATTGGSG